jgi:hypothetical protein
MPQAVFRPGQLRKRVGPMSAIWADSENICSQGVLPYLTRTGLTAICGLGESAVKLEAWYYTLASRSRLRRIPRSVCGGGQERLLNRRVSSAVRL